MDININDKITLSNHKKYLVISKKIFKLIYKEKEIGGIFLFCFSLL